MTSSLIVVGFMALYINNILFLLYIHIYQRFNNCIEITDSKDKKNRAIDVKISSSNNNSKRIRNIINDFHNGKSLSINKRDLLIMHEQSS